MVRKQTMKILERQGLFSLTTTLVFLFSVVVLLPGCAEPVSEEDIQALKVAKPSDLSNTETYLAGKFFFWIGDNRTTDIQIEDTLKGIKGEYVSWTVTVEDVEKITEKTIKVTTGVQPEIDVHRGKTSVYNSEAHVSAHVFLQEPGDFSYLAELKPGDRICLKGKLTGDSDALNRLVMRPAILCKHDQWGKPISGPQSVDSLKDKSVVPEDRGAEMPVDNPKTESKAEATGEQTSEDGDIKEIFRCDYESLHFSAIWNPIKSPQIYAVTVLKDGQSESIVLSESDEEVPLWLGDMRELKGVPSGRYELHGSGSCRSISLDFMFQNSRFLVNEEVCGASPPEGPPLGTVASVKERLEDGRIKKGYCTESPQRIRYVKRLPAVEMGRENPLEKTQTDATASSISGDRDETCDEIVGLMGRAKVLSVICPQRLDGYQQEFFLYGIQLPERCGSASGTQYQSLLREAEDKLRAEAEEMGTDRFCEANRPYGD